MAKQIVSARVPPRLSDRIEEYKETWNLSQTEAVTALLMAGLADAPDPLEVLGLEEGEALSRVFTVELSPENAEYVCGSDDVTPEEGINNILDFYRQ